MDFAAIIAAWYLENKRVLPWRETQNPYKIWLSEVILQQTRVEQGLPYYLKFTEKYPTVEELSAASEEEILKLWQGLGYYSRARNLHHTAQLIAEKFPGHFPTDYASLINLKGIGDYTASAISSFTANECHAVVDGNVYRVLSRVYGIDTPIDSTQGKKIFKELASELIDKKNPGRHNQAIMEFGALQCVPKNPGCQRCPLNEKCEAFRQKRVQDFPVKGKKQHTKDFFINYFLIRQNNYYFLIQRDDRSIWKNMYDLPFVESKKQPNDTAIKKLLAEQSWFSKFEISHSSEHRKHQLTHRNIYATFTEVRLDKKEPVPASWKKMKWGELPHLPVSRLLDRFLVEKFAGQD